MTNKIIDTFADYVMHNYIRYPIVFEKGQGSYLWDNKGDKYLDFFSGWATTGLGHSHPKVVKAIKKQAEKLIHIPNIYYSVPGGELAKSISKKSFPGKTFFCNSGAESNEAALKLARKFGHQDGRFQVITFTNSFHGRTFATITATAQPKYHQGFTPLLEGFKYLPFDNNIKTLEKAISSETAAIMLELIQGEGGINVVDKNYLQAMRDICDQKNILLIFDEVQTGIGRTGEYFAFQNYNIKPDIMTLAKGLGNGTAIGAMTVKDKFSNVLTPGTHASTFGGNPLACAAACAVFKAIEEENILDNVKSMGAYLTQQLEALKKEYPSLIKEVRGIGLMLGMELHLKDGSQIIKKCLDKKVLFNCTHGNVIRFMPMLNVSKTEIDEALGIFKEVISKL